MSQFFMPMPGSEDAPRFGSSPSDFDAFFFDVEELSRRASLSIPDMVRWSCRYAVPESESWQYVSCLKNGRFPPSFDDFKEEVLQLYPQLDRKRRYVIRDLEKLVERTNELVDMSRENLGLYTRDFTAISQFLIDQNRLSSRESNALYLQGFPPSIRSRILQRLAIRKPDVLPNDGYEFSDVREAALFVIEAGSAFIGISSSPSDLSKLEPRDHSQLNDLLDILRAMITNVQSQPLPVPPVSPPSPSSFQHPVPRLPTPGVVVQKSQEGSPPLQDQHSFALFCVSCTANDHLVYDCPFVDEYLDGSDSAEVNYFSLDSYGTDESNPGSIESNFVEPIDELLPSFDIAQSHFLSGHSMPPYPLPSYDNESVDEIQKIQDEIDALCDRHTLALQRRQRDEANRVESTRRRDPLQQDSPGPLSPSNVFCRPKTRVEEDPVSLSYSLSPTTPYFDDANHHDEAPAEFSVHFVDVSPSLKTRSVINVQEVPRVDNDDSYSSSGPDDDSPFPNLGLGGLLPTLSIGFEFESTVLSLVSSSTAASSDIGVSGNVSEVALEADDADFCLSSLFDDEFEPTLPSATFSSPLAVSTSVGSCEDEATIPFSSPSVDHKPIRFSAMPSRPSCVGYLSPESYVDDDFSEPSEAENDVSFEEFELTLASTVPFPPSRTGYVLPMLEMNSYFAEPSEDESDFESTLAFPTASPLAVSSGIWSLFDNHSSSDSINSSILSTALSCPSLVSPLYSDSDESFEDESECTDCNCSTDDNEPLSHSPILPSISGIDILQEVEPEVMDQNVSLHLGPRMSSTSSTTHLSPSYQPSTVTRRPHKDIRPSPRSPVTSPVDEPARVNQVAVETPLEFSRGPPNSFDRELADTKQVVPLDPPALATRKPSSTSESTEVPLTVRTSVEQTQSFCLRSIPMLSYQSLLSSRPCGLGKSAELLDDESRRDEFVVKLINPRLRSIAFPPLANRISKIDDAFSFSVCPNALTSYGIFSSPNESGPLSVSRAFGILSEAGLRNPTPFHCPLGIGNLLEVTDDIDQQDVKILGSRILTDAHSYSIASRVTNAADFPDFRSDSRFFCTTPSPSRPTRHLTFYLIPSVPDNSKMRNELDQSSLWDPLVLASCPYQAKRRAESLIEWSTRTPNQLDQVLDQEFATDSQEHLAPCAEVIERLKFYPPSGMTLSIGLEDPRLTGGGANSFLSLPRVSHPEVPSLVPSVFSSPNARAIANHSLPLCPTFPLEPVKHLDCAKRRTVSAVKPTNRTPTRLDRVFDEGSAIACLEPLEPFLEVDECLKRNSLSRTTSTYSLESGVIDFRVTSGFLDSSSARRPNLDGYKPLSLITVSSRLPNDVLDGRTTTVCPEPLEASLEVSEHMEDFVLSRAPSFHALELYRLDSRLIGHIRNRSSLPRGDLDDFEPSSSFAGSSRPLSDVIDERAPIPCTEPLVPSSEATQHDLLGRIPSSDDLEFDIIDSRPTSCVHDLSHPSRDGLDGFESISLSIGFPRPPLFVHPSFDPEVKPDYTLDCGAPFMTTKREISRISISTTEFTPLDCPISSVSASSGPLKVPSSTFGPVLVDLEDQIPQLVSVRVQPFVNAMCCTETTRSDEDRNLCILNLLTRHCLALEDCYHLLEASRTLDVSRTCSRYLLIANDPATLDVWLCNALVPRSPVTPQLAKLVPVSSQFTLVLCGTSPKRPFCDPVPCESASASSNLSSLSFLCCLCLFCHIYLDSSHSTYLSRRS